MTFSYGRLFREIEQHMIDDAMARWYPKAPRTEPLDHAWQEAEDALPEGWWVERVYLRERGTPLETFSAWARRPDSDGGLRGDGPTPAAALLGLADILRGVTR